MDRVRLLKHFESLADTPDAVAKLRELVLSLAVRGKLVAQSPADDSADALARNTQALAQKIAREERLKLPTPELPVSDTDKVFALPTGWAWVKLGNICLKLGAGSTPLGGKQVYEKTGIKFLRSQNIWNEGLHLDDVAFIPPSVYADMSATGVRPGDILLNITGASIGRSSIVPDDFDQANVSQHVSIVRLAEKTIRHFVHLYIIAPDFQKRIMAVQVGVSREGLSMARLKEFVIPLPPLAEQKRIVARVEELLALCDELEARQTAAREQRTRLVHSAFDHLTAARDESEFRKHSAFCLQHSDLLFDSVPALRQAILSLAVQGHLVERNIRDGDVSTLLHKIGATPIEPEGAPLIAAHWKWANLGSLVTRMNSGWSPDCPSTPAGKGEWGVLRTTAVQTLRYIEEENKVLPRNLEARPEHEVKAGDILITRAGPKNRVGISCVVQTTRPRLMISDKIVRFHLHESLDPSFVALCLNAGHSKVVLEQLKSGMAESQMNISQPKLKTTPIPIPPLAEQQRIVAKVAALMSWCDQLEAQLAAEQSAAAALLDSSLHALLAPAG